MYSMKPKKTKYIYIPSIIPLIYLFILLSRGERSSDGKLAYVLGMHILIYVVMFIVLLIIANLIVKKNVIVNSG